MYLVLFSFRGVGCTMYVKAHVSVRFAGKQPVRTFRKICFQRSLGIDVFSTENVRRVCSPRESLAHMQERVCDANFLSPTLPPPKPSIPIIPDNALVPGFHGTPSALIHDLPTVWLPDYALPQDYIPELVELSRTNLEKDDGTMLSSEKVLLKVRGVLSGLRHGCWK